MLILQKLEKLPIKFESFNTKLVDKISAVDSVHLNNAKTLDIINKVDAFYNNAWGKMILMVTIFVTLLGIIVPFVLNYFLKKETDDREKRLRIEIEKEYQDAIKKLDKKNEEALNAKFITMEYLLLASTKHMQGMVLSSQNNHDLAALNCLECIILLAKANQPKNIVKSFNNVLNSLSQSTKAGFEKRLNEIDVTFAEKIIELKKETNGLGFDPLISDIVDAYKGLK